MTTIPESYYPLLATIESGNRLYVKAATSSASGLYQPTRGTWISLGGAWGPDPSKAFGGLRPTAAQQLAIIRKLTESNAAILTQRGVAINLGSLYAAHFLGAGTAARLLAAPDTADAATIAGKAATDANPSVLRGKTVGQVKDWLGKKTGTRP